MTASARVSALTEVPFESLKCPIRIDFGKVRIITVVQIQDCDDEGVISDPQGAVHSFG